MSAKNYPQIAALVLTKCAAYDAYLTAPTEETCLAWAEQFELYGNVVSFTGGPAFSDGTDEDGGE